MKKGVYGLFKLLNISYKNNMKIGIISDIHGNIDALNSVLKMLEKEEVDKIICLGDFIGRSRKI